MKGASHIIRRCIMSGVLAIIPARAGSKGIPNKNMHALNGIPLMKYTIQSAIKSDIIDHICLSTDSEEYRKYGLKCGIEVPFLRPSELATDSSSTVSVVDHALNWYIEYGNFNPEYILLLQPTSPFRRPESIKKALDMIKENKANSLISVNEVSAHPCEYIVPNNNSSFTYVMNPPQKAGRQNYPLVYFINGAIYLFKASYFKETKQIFDNQAALLVTENFESVDIDDMFDLVIAESICSTYKEKINWLV